MLDKVAKANHKFLHNMHLLARYIPGQDSIFFMIEKIRKLYEYPNMLGRKVSAYKGETDILVFAAHPDDDILGLGFTLYNHIKEGKKVRVVYVTNGTANASGIGQSWNLKREVLLEKAKIRYDEGSKALSTILSIPKENINCLGYPDKGLHRYLRYLSEDVEFLLEYLKPKRVYVHCIEGGHRDHDMTSFIVKSMCNKLNYDDVYEWAQYNSIQPLGTTDVKFIDEDALNLGEALIISDKERELKRKMLSYHQSQNVEDFYNQGETIRKAKRSNLDQDLFKYCQIPNLRLIPIIRKYNAYLNSFRSR